MTARHGDMLGLEGISLHFVWKADYESVAEYGLLSYFLRTRLGIACGRPYKAQQQLGTDLISIWDPWSFLRRHWRNCPLGSDNKPWEIIDLVLEEYFADPVDLALARSLRDADENRWVGESVCRDRKLRKRLDAVRQRIAGVVMEQGSASGLDASEILRWLDATLESWTLRSVDSVEELCIVLAPGLRRYDFPGYKQFENFVRGRISPSEILGIVVPRRLSGDAAVKATARRHGHAVCVADGRPLVIRRLD